MSGPELDKSGMLVGPRLVTFNRYIDQGMSCLLQLVFGDGSPPEPTRSVQISLTPSQCRAIAENLLMCADVIELERPTAPQ